MTSETTWLLRPRYSWITIFGLSFLGVKGVDDIVRADALVVDLEVFLVEPHHPAFLHPGHGHRQQVRRVGSLRGRKLRFSCKKKRLQKKKNSLKTNAALANLCYLFFPKKLQFLRATVTDQFPSFKNKTNIPVEVEREKQMSACRTGAESLGAFSVPSLQLGQRDGRFGDFTFT